MYTKLNLKKGPFAGWVRGNATNALLRVGQIAIDQGSGELVQLVKECKSVKMWEVLCADGSPGLASVDDLIVSPYTGFADTSPLTAATKLKDILSRIAGVLDEASRECDETVDVHLHFAPDQVAV